MCPAGTYQDVAGQPSCKPCEIGTYQDQKGQTFCIACPANSSTAEKGSESVAKCLCNGGFGLSNSSSTEKCNAKFHKKGEKIIGECKKVAKGKYSPNLNNCIVSCPENSSTAEEGSSDLSECLCKGGFGIDVADDDGNICPHTFTKNGKGEPAQRCKKVAKGQYSPDLNNCIYSCPQHSSTKSIRLKFL